MLRDCFDMRKVIPTTVHDEMMKHFRSYMAIGGMPEVVAAYVECRDYLIIDKLQRDLLMGYQYDIGHYATIKAEKCYMSLGKQLLDKENHKFQYKEVEKGGRAQKYFSSIEWLIRADILYKNGYDLYFYKNDTTRKEIDILIQKDGYVIPIEVKSGNNTAVSLNRIMEKYSNIDAVYKFIDGNMGVGDNGVITAPLYAAMFI